MVYRFKNTCPHCLTKVEIPVLSDFSYGQLILQTEDGKEFCMTHLLDNPAYDYIVDVMETHPDFKDCEINPQDILSQVADQYEEMKFTTDYPICPVCQEKFDNLSSEVKGKPMSLIDVTWENFKGLTQENKLREIKKVIRVLNNK